MTAFIFVLLLLVTGTLFEMRRRFAKSNKEHVALRSKVLSIEESLLGPESYVTEEGKTAYRSREKIAQPERPKGPLHHFGVSIMKVTANSQDVRTRYCPFCHLGNGLGTSPLYLACASTSCERRGDPHLHGHCTTCNSNWTVDPCEEPRKTVLVPDLGKRN